MPQQPKFDLLTADFHKSSTKNCCGSGEHRFDIILWASLAIILISIVAHSLIPHSPAWLQRFADTTIHLARQSWWAIIGGIIAMAVLSQTPKELIAKLLGKPGTWNGILRATAAGLLLDLCNHGILMVAIGLYKRGASLGQTIAFLIASPWNSLSLTLLLTALIGWQWTLIFVLLSALIGMTTGYAIEILTRRKVLPHNPHSLTKIPTATRAHWQIFFRSLRPTTPNLIRLLRIGIKDSRMILRWILLGFVITAAVKAFIPVHWLQHHFGPTLAGLLLTLCATTLIEVCSEGSSPLAAEIFHTAKAPGNAFTFLMAGTATDYTEILSLRATTGRWLCALALPILSVPQVLALGYLLNQ